MPRRVLYLGEGERDIGRFGERQVGCDYEGDLPRLVRKIANHVGVEGRFGYDASTIREVASRTLARDARPTRVGGKSKQLRDAVVYSVRDGDPSPAAVIALIDATAAEFDRLAADARDIVNQCSEARNDVRVAIGIALHEVEIWMLTDPESRLAAFGPEAGTMPMPEGHHEDFSDPKSLWLTYAGHGSPPDGVTVEQFHDNQRLAAWQSLRPDVAARSCPRGFAPFLAASAAVLN
jgi:hypothetical protein